MSDASEPFPAVPAERLFGYLREANGLRRLWEVGAAALRTAAAFVAAVLVAVALDAAFGFPPRVLVAIDVLLLSVLGSGLLRLPAIAWRRRFHPRRAAVELEHALGLDDSRLIAAVDLAAGASPAASPALRARAVRLGDELAATLPTGAAVDRALLARAARWLAIALLVMGGVYVAFPRVFHAVLPRLLQPYADHPPFTLLEFAVDTEPETVIQGHAAAIRVAVAGPALPDQASLVWVSPEGPLQRVPLLRTSAPHDVVGDSAGGSDDARHFILRLDRADADRAFYIDTAHGRSRRYTLDVVPVPLFEEVIARYDYPAYTGWPATREPLRTGGLRALEGTNVTLEVTSNVPLEGGTLTLTPGEDTQASPDVRRLVTDARQRHAGTFGFTLAFSGELEAVLHSGGLTTPDPLRAPVTSVPDEAPRVSFAEPSQTVVAPEGWSVDAVVDASDDIGLSRLVLHRAVNGFAPSAMELPPAGADKRRSQAGYRFDLAALGARAGDVITYFATAYDNRPEPQFTQTGVYVIQVVSREEYEEFARTQYRIDDLQAEWEAFQQRLDDLQARRDHALNELEQLQQEAAAGEPLTPEQQARLEQLEAELGEYRAEALDLASDMRERAEQAPLYDFEQAYKDQLERTEQELQMQAGEADATRRALQQMRQNPSPDAAQRLSRQAERFRERDQPFNEQMAGEREQLAEDIERVRLADEMAGAAERIRQVIGQQRDLAERMQQFKDRDALGPDEQRLASKLASEQADLRRELEDAHAALQDAVARAGDKLPKMSGSGQQLCDALASLDVPTDQLGAEQGAYAGRGADAARDARTAADKLDTLLSDCQAMGNTPGDLDGCLSLPRESWANAMNQLAQGRGVPGLGNRSGDGGSGFSGSAARMAVVGPAPRGGGDGPSRSAAHTGGRGGQPGAPGAEDAAADVERIDAQAAADRAAHVAALSGVPSQYRETAEAYFRRLLEDERYDRDVNSSPGAP